MLAVIAGGLQAIQARILLLDREIAIRAKANSVAKRLMTIPGIGPVVAIALMALAPAASTFRRGRDFAAWLGLTPRQHSSGGTERLGRTTKMGGRSLRKLLILGANSATKVAALMWTGMASANVTGALRWKRAKTHRVSRRRR